LWVCLTEDSARNEIIIVMFTDIMEISNIYVYYSIHVISMYYIVIYSFLFRHRINLAFITQLVFIIRCTECIYCCCSVALCAHIVCLMDYATLEGKISKFYTRRPSHKHHEHISKLMAILQLMQWSNYLNDENLHLVCATICTILFKMCTYLEV
jgi:hypothetical protein